MSWKFWVALPGACVGAWAGVKIAGATSALGILGAGAAGAAVGSVALPVAVGAGVGVIWGGWWLAGKLLGGTIGKFADLVKGGDRKKTIDQLEAEFNRDRKEHEQVRQYLEKQAANDFSESAKAPARFAPQERQHKNGPKAFN